MGPLKIHIEHRKTDNLNGFGYEFTPNSLLFTKKNVFHTQAMLQLGAKWLKVDLVR